VRRAEGRVAQVLGEDRGDVGAEREALARPGSEHGRAAPADGDGPVLIDDVERLGDPSQGPFEDEVTGLGR